ncbi:MAG: sugar ABC transporter permease, partial [Elusimicrobiota bacterium]|nr:sugar ABC transporter permease [Elusimicrobiota bacterium]
MQRFLKRYYFLFSALTFAAFIVSFIIPLCMNIYLSFTRFNSFNDFLWVGAANYLDIFAFDSPFIASLIITAKFVIISVVSVNISAFLLAFLLIRGLKGFKLFKSAFFMLSLFSAVVLGYIWQIVFASALNSLFGINLADISKYGFWQLVFALNWQLIGYIALIYIMSIRSVSKDKDILEAARVDGASNLRIFLSIKTPVYIQAFLISIFLTAFYSFKVFEQNLIAYLASKDAPQLAALNI